MSFKIGDIGVIKVTGEKVFVLSVTEYEAIVRRPSIQESGAIRHNKETFGINELESLSEHADRQVAEMMIKQRAQKTLALNEQKLMEDLQQEQYTGPLAEEVIEEVVPELSEDIDEEVLPAAEKVVEFKRPRKSKKLVN
jgi:hypothetical protein